MLTAPPADDASAQIDGTERNMNGKLRVAAVSVALVVLAGLVLLVVRPGLNPARIRPLPLIAGAWIVFLAAAWLLRAIPRRSAVALILLGGIAVQLAALSAPPKQSNDLYRYVWDGKVQAAGIDPYQYVYPPATQLTGLRNDFLFYPKAEYCVRPSYTRKPSGGRPHPRLHQDQPADGAHHLPAGRQEAYFLGVHYLPTGSDSAKPIQATTALVAVLITVLLDVRPGPAGPGGQRRPCWSWCPTVALEAGNSAHVTWVAVGIATVAILVLGTARTRARTALGGVLLGLAIATKMTPALIGPAVLRRRWVTVAVSAGSAFVAVYIPHILRVGGKVIGFLPGYLQQENYTTPGPGTDHRPVRHRAAGQRDGGAHPGRDRPGRAGVRRPRPALAGRLVHDRGRARDHHPALPVVLATAGHAGRPRRPPGVARVRRGRVLRSRGVPGALHPAVAAGERDRLRRAAGRGGHRLADPPRAGTA